MANSVVLLNDPETLIADFTTLLSTSDKALFVILGDSQACHDLANAAQLYAENWRYVVLVTKPAIIQSDLTGLSKAAGVSPVPAYGQWCTIGVSFDGTIVLINEQLDVADVVPTFMLSESYIPGT